jgi:uncharacterized protein (TIGR03435 family)
MKRCIFAAVALVCCVARGQQGGADGAFEVATVKASAPNEDRIGFDKTADSLTLRNLNLRLLIQTAYNLREDQISGGPKWVSSQGFDIVGKADAAILQLSDAERLQRMKLMLRSLLAERFHLILRREMKDVPAYTLDIAKGGLKLKKLEPGGKLAVSGRPNLLLATNASVREFIDLLANRLRKPVLDRTGLDGIYDFRVQFAPENVPDSPDPSLFTALQEQCGLKLDATMAPAETFVIESVAQPSEN